MLQLGGGYSFPTPFRPQYTFNKRAAFGAQSPNSDIPKDGNFRVYTLVPRLLSAMRKT